MTFSSIKFTDLLSNIIDNRGKTCPVTNVGIPLIATNCINGIDLYPSYQTTRFVAEETYKTWFRGHPKPGDILFVCKGSPGRTSWVPDPVNFCIAQDMVAVRADPLKVYPQYLFAALRSGVVQAQINNMHVGTMIPHFKKGDFDKLLIPLPNSHLQYFIGDLYFSISKRIALLHETNSNLGLIAQALYKSWFIDFDPIRAKQEDRPIEGIDKTSASLFPDSFEKSELGDIPKGWQICNLGDISYRHMDKIKDSNDWANLPLIDLARLNSKQLFNESYGIGSELNTSVTRFEKGDLLFGAIRPYFHKVSLAQVDGVTNVSVLVIRPKEELSYAFLVNLLYLDATVDFAVRLSKGTKMPVISWADLSTLKIILPPESIMESFNEEIMPLIKKGLENATSIQLLTEIRDTLLPRLILGQLKITDLEEQIKEVA